MCRLVAAIALVVIIAGCTDQEAEPDTVTINVTEVVERITEYVTVDVWHTTETMVVEEDTTPDVVTIHEYHYPSGPVPALMLEEDGGPAMADGPISALAAATSLGADDLLLISQSGTSKKLTAELLGGSLFGPENVLRDNDDFLNDTLDGKWTEVLNGAGSVGIVQSRTGRQGVYAIYTGTTSSGFAIIHRYHSGMWPKVGQQRFDIGVQIPTLSDGTDRYTLVLGFGDSNTGTTDNVDGYYFKYSDNVNSGKWQLVTSNSSTRTTADSGITVAASTWYGLTAILNAAGTSVEFFIDGVSVGTITTNIPGATRTYGANGRIVKALGTNSRSVEFDWFNLTEIFETPRY
jgi:hypothetical protein